MKCEQQDPYILWGKLEPLRRKWAHKLQGGEYSFEDLQQESYLILLKALASYKAEKKMTFEAYYKILLYRWGANYKRKVKEVVVFGEETETFWSQILDEKVNIESELIKAEQISEQQEQLKRAFERLTPSEKELMVRLYINQEKMIALSQEKHILYTTLESKKRYALKKLRKFFTFL